MPSPNHAQQSETKRERIAASAGEVSRSIRWIEIHRAHGQVGFTAKGGTPNGRAFALAGEALTRYRRAACAKAAMLDFSDQPYVFVGPRPNRFLIAMARACNRWRAFPASLHRLTGLELDDATGLDGRWRSEGGARILMLPNHSRHSDCEVMIETQRRLGVISCYMAAYDLFHRGKIARWILPRLGAFSVDREGSDTKALRTATAVLTGGRHALTIFPEGNVYLTNDRVTPFIEGAALVALRAQKELGAEAPVLVVPVSITYSLVEDGRAEVRRRLEHLAAEAGMRVVHAAALREEMVRVGLSLLRLQLTRHGHSLPEAAAGETEEPMRWCAQSIIGRLEQRLGVSPRQPEDLIGRIRKIRTIIHQARTGGTTDMPEAEAETLAREAMLALRVLSYSGTYVRERPTLDRFAETVEKLEEDWTGRFAPALGRRCAVVRLNPPINVADLLSIYTTSARQAIQQLTRAVESSVQAGLEHSRGRLATPGTEVF